MLPVLPILESAMCTSDLPSAVAMADPSLPFADGAMGLDLFDAAVGVDIDDEDDDAVTPRATSSASLSDVRFAFDAFCKAKSCAAVDATPSVIGGTEPGM